MKKMISCLLIGLILLSLIPFSHTQSVYAAEEFDNIPYFSDSELQGELIEITRDQIYGNARIEGDTARIDLRNDIATVYGTSSVDYDGVTKNIIGSDELFQDSQQIAATIENDAIAIIKDSGRDNSAELDALMDRIYSSDPDNPGIVDHIESGYAAWTDEEKEFYHQQAQITTTLDVQLTDLISATNAVRPTLDGNTETELTNDNPRDGEDGFASGPLPEYSQTSRNLHLLSTNDLSFITGKDRTFWTSATNPPTNSYTLLDIAETYRVLSYMRAKVVLEKFQAQREAQLGQTQSLQNEVNDILGYVSPSPYDMQSIVQAIRSKIYTTVAVTSPLSGANVDDDGFAGASDPDISLPWLYEPTEVPPDVSAIEPVTWDGYTNFLTDIETQYTTAVSAVDSYQSRYESNPNLNQGGTYAAFETASTELTKLRDLLLTTLNDVISDVNKRVSDAQIQADNFDAVLGNLLAVESAASGIWNEVRDALVNNVTWMLSQFGKLLNYGMEDLGGQTALLQMHQIILTIANLGFVLIIALAGLAISMEWNVNAYQLRKMLPRFLAGIVLVNASMLIAQIFTDTSLIVTNLFLTQAKTLTDSAFTSEIFSRVGGTNATLGLSSGATSLLFGGILSPNLSSSANSLFANDLASIMILALIFMIITAVNILLVIRSAGIWLLVVIAPLAYLLWILPSTTITMRTWWKYFLILVFLAPLIAIVFLIGVSLGSIGFTDDFLRVLIGVGSFGLMLAAPNAMGSLANGIAHIGASGEADEPATRPTPPRDYPRSPTPNPTNPSSGGGTSAGNENGNGVAETPRNLMRNLVSSDSLKQLMSREKQHAQAGSTSKRPSLQEILSNRENGKVERVNELTNPAGQVIVNFINTGDWQGLVGRMEEMIQDGELKANIINPVISNDKGLDFLGNAILNQKSESGTAKEIIERYYSENTSEISKLIERIEGKSSLDAQPTVEVLKVGLDPLGEKIQAEPENAEYKQVARQIVTRLPDYVGEFASGGEKRKIAISAGIQGATNEAELSAVVVTQIPQAELGQIPAQMLATGVNELAQNKPETLKNFQVEAIVKGAANDEGIKSTLSGIINKLNTDVEKIGTPNGFSADVAGKVVSLESELQSMNLEIRPEVKEKINLASATIEKVETDITESVPVQAEIGGVQSADALLQELKAQTASAPVAEIPKVESPSLDLTASNLSGENVAVPEASITPVGETTADHSASAENVATSMQYSPMEMFALLQGDLNNLSADNVESIFQLPIKQQERYRGALQTLTEGYGQADSSLNDQLKGVLENHQAELDVLGAPLPRVQIEPDKGQQLMSLLNQTPADKLSTIPINVYGESLTAMLQTAPQFVQPEQANELVNRLDQNPQEAGALLNQILAENSQVPVATKAVAISTIATQHPEQLRPEHVNQVIAGLQSGVTEFKGSADQLAAAFNSASGKVGLNGTLRTDTAAALVKGQGVLAGQNIQLSPYENAELNGEVVAQTNGEAVGALSNEVFYDGMGNLAVNNSQAILPEHVARSVEGLQSAPELAAPVMQDVAARFNETDASTTNQPLSEGSVMLLASQAESLQQAEIKLDQTALENVFSQALKKGIDVKGMNSLEDAVRDIPRQLSKAPGAQTMAAAMTETASSASAASEASEMTRESVNNDSQSIMRKASNAQEEIDFSDDNSDLSAYAANAKVDGQDDILTPKLILAEDMPDLSKEDF